MSTTLTTSELGMTIVTIDSVEMTLEQLERQESNEANLAYQTREQERTEQDGDPAMLQGELTDTNWAEARTITHRDSDGNPYIREEYKESTTDFTDRLPNTMFLGRHMVELDESEEGFTRWNNGLKMAPWEVVCPSCNLTHHEA